MIRSSHSRSTPISAGLRASTSGSAARSAAAAGTGPGSGRAGASVVMAAMTASRAESASCPSRCSAGVARSVSVVPSPTARTNFPPADPTLARLLGRPATSLSGVIESAVPAQT